MLLPLPTMVSHKRTTPEYQSLQVKIQCISAWSVTHSCWTSLKRRTTYRQITSGNARPYKRRKNVTSNMALKLHTLSYTSCGFISSCSCPLSTKHDTTTAKPYRMLVRPASRALSAQSEPPSGLTPCCVRSTNGHVANGNAGRTD